MKASQISDHHTLKLSTRSTLIKYGILDSSSSTRG